MKLYLDTADGDAWDDLMPTGLFHGITTNPLLAERAGLEYARIDWSKMAGKAHELGAKELHAQVYGPAEEYVDWAEKLYAVGEAAGIEIVVKIPLVEETIRVTPAIKALGGRILMTACYDAKQMFVAKALRTDFLSPYFGRMKEAGIDAETHLAAMEKMNRPDVRRCEVLVASLRSAAQMVTLANLGHDHFTISPDVARELLTSPHSIKAFTEFEEAISSS
ncbi:transaldolase family protein [Sulfitobacter sp.]|uniref:transaldolase family protein n=1 Tax=Sulfitobacter sp. TaxID=1903071 RepID=UPI003001056E